MKAKLEQAKTDCHSLAFILFCCALLLSFATILFKCYRYIRYFDVCIIDEASQCTEPWSLVALQYQIKNLILVGDTNQLSPVVLSSVGSSF